MSTSALTTNENLRALLRTARSHARISQKDAAAKAGVSVAWWKRVESAYETAVAPETLAAMLDAVGVVPLHLESMGEYALARLLETHQSFRETADSSRNRDDGRLLEEYLMNAPASDDIRRALVAFARNLRSLRLRPEPFQDQFLPPVKE